MRRYQIEIRKKQFTIDVQEMSANRFYVLVNGEEYEVSMLSGADLLPGIVTPQIVPLSQVAPPVSYKPSAIETLEPLPRASQPALPPRPQLDIEPGVQQITAPMPGVILSVFIQPGDEVKRGQVVATLEAMKMKNAIKSPVDAVVAEILVSPGQSVGFGDVLVRFA